MKDSKEKEHTISNLKDLIDNVKEDNPSEDPQEDKELINYLEDSSEFDKLDIDDEYIYHPDNNKADVVNLEDAPIDRDFLINTPKEEKLDDLVAELEEPEDIPSKYIKQMVCDWEAMPIKFGGTPQEYYLENCSTCDGNSFTKSLNYIMDDLEKEISRIKSHTCYNHITVEFNPLVLSKIKANYIDLINKINKKYKINISLAENKEISYEKYKIIFIS